MTTDQTVSSAWYLDGINLSRSAQSWTHIWSASEIGKHNVTYAGTNGNGSVRITWNVSVITSSTYDVNQDGYVNNTDLQVISLHFGEVTAAPYPRYDVNTDNLVDTYDIIEVSTSIPQS